MRNIISKQEAAKLINNAGPTIFSVTFIKRSTGEVREGVFRLGYTVSAGLAGGEAPYSFDEKGLIPVYRMGGDNSTSAGMRRTIPIEGIMSLNIHGKHYEVN